MNRPSASQPAPSLIAWKIQPSDSGALSAFLQALQRSALPPNAAFLPLADGASLTWDPRKTPSAAVRNAALEAARTCGSTLRGTLLAPLDDAARAAIASEALAEPRMSERSILEAAIERSWTF
ncbi:MAG: hypothetical protein PXZ07_09340 [Candidatus Eremiobacteraeota bacterium]|nr:hypothetical protein [Candidatus Eremiobacteraeota bacterium]